MNEAGLKRKFRMADYVAQVNRLVSDTLATQATETLPKAPTKRGRTKRKEEEQQVVMDKSPRKKRKKE